MVPNTDIVYVDECGVDKFMAREYGRAKIGKRVFLPKPGRKFKRINVVGALVNGKSAAIKLYDRSINSIFFLSWFKYELCPNLQENSIIVLDNASFHKKFEVEKIAQLYKCHVLWLPPYSPDKNKIEKLWANMKNWLRINALHFPTIQDAIWGYFKSE